MSEEQNLETLVTRCQICGDEMQVQVPVGEDLLSQKLRRMASAQAVHNVCIDNAAAVRKAKAEKERASQVAFEHEQRWAKLCPAEYRKVIDFKRPECSRAKYEEVMAWQPAGSSGLLLAGETGLCKTRFLWALLRREWEAGRQFYVSRHPEWRLKASRIAGESQQDLESWIRMQAEMPLWVIDDLGKGAITPASEEALESVIDQRTREGRPIVLTTNDSAESLKARLSADRGLPMLRRIMDHCAVVKFAFAGK